VFAFDLLYLNGESLLHQTLAERRKKLVSSFQQVDAAFRYG
jgi:DNA ligase-1